MGNLNEKIQQAKKDIKSKDNKIRKINIEKLLFIGIIIIFALLIIFYISFLTKFKNMIDTKTLNDGKTLRLICLFLSIIGTCLSICLANYFEGSKLYSLYFISIFTFIFSTVFLIGSIGCSHNSEIKSIYYDSEQKVAYYEVDGVYTVEKIFDNSNVTIYGEIDGKIVSSIKTGLFNSQVQTITLQGGKWEFYQGHFYSAIALKKLVINDAEVTVSANTFDDNSYLSEVYINNGTLKTNFSTKNKKNQSKISIFSNSDIDIYLNNGSLVNLADDINLLEISGVSNVQVNVGETKDKKISFNVKKLVINDNIILKESTLKRNIFTYKTGIDQYYSLGNQIYLPASIDTLPDYFFGDKLVSDDTKIKVYFEGTQEEWDKISIGENGNGNYYSGNVIVTINNE